MKKDLNKIIFLVSVIVLLALAVAFYELKDKDPAVTSVIFTCKDSKVIIAKFDTKTDKGVDLRLSDGRELFVPHAISASGARYANKDETFVFWNKGNTAFITEGKEGKLTFIDCIIDGGMAMR
jgi:membrane-bound inhibitor of C-type lysozyme